MRYNEAICFNYQAAGDAAADFRIRAGLKCRPLTRRFVFNGRDSGYGDQNDLLIGAFEKCFPFFLVMRQVIVFLLWLIFILQNVLCDVYPPLVCLVCHILFCESTCTSVHLSFSPTHLPFSLNSFTNSSYNVFQAIFLQILHFNSLDTTHGLQSMF